MPPGSLAGSLSTTHSSRIRCGNQWRVTRRRDEGDVGLSLPTGLVHSTVHLLLRFEKHGTCGMNSYAAIAVVFRQRTGLYDNDNRTRMGVPPGIAARLKHQQALQNI